VPLADLASIRPVTKIRALAKQTWAPATLLGMAMVARGEIGLLIIQIGLNQTPFLSEEAFITAAWAIVLNTIIGPVGVGVLLGKLGKHICDDPRWGTQVSDSDEFSDENSSSDGVVKVKPGRQWISRRHSRSVSFAASSRDPSRGRSAYTSRAPSESRAAQSLKPEGVMRSNIVQVGIDENDEERGREQTRA